MTPGVMGTTVAVETAAEACILQLLLGSEALPVDVGWGSGLEVTALSSVRTAVILVAVSISRFVAPGSEERHTVSYRRL